MKAKAMGMDAAADVVDALDATADEGGHLAARKNRDFYARMGPFTPDP